MNNVILFDDFSRDNLLPFTLNKPVCELMVGILSIRQKWEYALKATCSYITQDYLAEKYPIRIQAVNYVVNGSVLPTREILLLVKELEDNAALTRNGELIAAKLNQAQFEKLMREEEIDELAGVDIQDTPILKVNQKWDLFQHNYQAIELDLEFITKNRSSDIIPEHVQTFNPENIFIEDDVTLEACIIDASDGPVYIGAGSIVMHNAVIKGPFSAGEGCQIKMGASIYGSTCLGDQVKLGGEVKNASFMSFSNKGHGGFVGDAVIGQWCNLGAGTNTSNMKNNYGNIKIWNYASRSYEDSGRMFCGLMMGDHCKAGINTMFNTGTVVGFAVNVFGSGMPPKFLEDFSWADMSKEPVVHKFSKAVDTADKMMARRGEKLKEMDIKIWEHIFEHKDVQ